MRALNKVIYNQAPCALVSDRSAPSAASDVFDATVSRGTLRDGEIAEISSLNSSRSIWKSSNLNLFQTEPHIARPVGVLFGENSRSLPRVQWRQSEFSS